MVTIGQQAKSKTIKFNAILAVVFVALKTFGVEIPDDIGASLGDIFSGCLVVGNYILRLVTKEPLSAK